jgi:hypothetical protein
MPDNSTPRTRALDEVFPQNYIDENRKVWFWMLVSYLKIRTLELWLKHHPQATYESFDLIWPSLFDVMLRQATKESAQKLREQVIANWN